MLDCRYAVITRGEHGMALFGRDGERLQIPSVAHTVYDVSGAGDTVIATLALALASGALDRNGDAAGELCRRRGRRKARYRDGVAGRDRRACRPILIAR